MLTADGIGKIQKKLFGYYFLLWTFGINFVDKYKLIRSVFYKIKFHFSKYVANFLYMDILNL